MPQLSLLPLSTASAVVLPLPEAFSCTVTSWQRAVGSSVSFTVTLKLQVPVLPDASVAVTVTEVVPTSKKEPLPGTAEAVSPGQLSLDEKSKNTTAPQTPASLPTVMLIGQVGTGSMLSSTITV
jgi:hypothetical protein